MTQRPDTTRPAAREAAAAGLALSLPTVSTNSLAGMLEEIAAPPYNGKADLPHLADSLTMEIDDCSRSAKRCNSCDWPNSQRPTSS